MWAFDVWIDNGDKVYLTSVYAASYEEAEKEVGHNILPGEKILGVERIG